MAARCFVTNLGAGVTEAHQLSHSTECFNAQVCQKWSKEGDKELTFLSPEELADRLRNIFI